MTSALLLAACRPAQSTPLTSAALRGNVAHVKTLLATTSADTSADGWPPLIWAARAGRVEVMTLLLDAGADPNRPDPRQGWTPLMHALHKQQGAAARLLLARGADGARGAGGTSPIEMAALDRPLLGSCHTETVRLLLASDRSMAHAGEGPGSPLWWARRQGCQEVIAMVAGRQHRKFGPKNALNDGCLRYVIKLMGERKLNCRQQAQS